MHRWILLAVTPGVVRRSLCVSLVVGSVLVLINHGDALVRADITPLCLMKMVLTYAVPYGVTTCASVEAIRARL